MKTCLCMCVWVYRTQFHTGRTLCINSSPYQTYSSFQSPLVSYLSVLAGVTQQTSSAIQWALNFPQSLNLSLGMVLPRFTPSSNFLPLEVNVLLPVNNSLCETLPLQIAAWFLSPEWPWLRHRISKFWLLHMDSLLISKQQHRPDIYISHHFFPWSCRHFSDYIVAISRPLCVPVCSLPKSCVLSPPLTPWLAPQCPLSIRLWEPNPRSSGNWHLGLPNTNPYLDDIRNWFLFSFFPVLKLNLSGMTSISNI